MRHIIASLAFVASACAAVGGSPQDAQQAVYQLEGEFTVALSVAVAYSKLPKCGQPASPTLCSQDAIVVQLQKAAHVAQPALAAAQAVVTAPNSGANASTVILAAQQAITAFSSITNTLKVKP